jgi:hypothetical protein
VAKIVSNKKSSRIKCEQHLDALLSGDLELVLEVDVTGGEEGVDAVVRRVLNGLVGASDVLLRGAGET